MSGLGKRFISAGFTQPKPLIAVDEKPMIEHVVNLFPDEKNILFICNEEHLKKTELKQILTKLKPSAKIHSISYRGLGPVDAVLQATEFIDDTESVVVNYCDFFMKWNYDDFQKKMKKTNVDGAVICYKGFHPHLLGNDLYASVNVDKNNLLLEIREKHSFTPNKMDSWQSAGTYYFKSGKMVKKYFKKLIDLDIKINGEYYVSLVYNLMQEDGLKTLVYPIDYFCQWGTPNDLKAYQYWSNYFRLPQL